jgi:glycosyltransferase involved in cell wall biosynthesis
MGLKVLKNSGHRPEVVFVTHDSVSDQFDRRITDQAEIFAREGWNVFVACSSHQGSLVRKGKLTLVGFSNRVSKNDFIEFESSLKSCQEDTGDKNSPERDMPEVRKRSYRVSFIHYFGKLLSLRLKNYLKSSKLFISAIRLITSEPSMVLPIWLEQSAKSFFQVRDSRPDLIVACDLPAAIGVMPIAMRHNIKWWFDAHEIFTEQNWVKAQGETEKIKDLEKLVIRNATYFSSVNQSAITHLLEAASVVRKSIVITNALKLEREDMITTDENQLLNKKIRFIFHGGLSSGRSLYDFVSGLLKCADTNWSIDLFGWDPDPRLAEFDKDERIRVLSQVTTESIPELLADYDCVVLPYKVWDINTLYAMPNKLGDAIATKLPVIYNEELVEVDKNNNLYGFGVPFKYGNRLEETSASLDSALSKLRLFSTDWQKVQKDLGYAWNEVQILKIIQESTS